MIIDHIISTMLIMPIIGVILIMLNKKDSVKIGLCFSVMTFIIAMLIYLAFDINDETYQFQEHHQLVSLFDIYYRVGINGISLSLVLLTTFLTPICIIASTRSISHNIVGFVISFLILETLVLGVFCAQDLMLFYLFFEAILIPMYMIIGIWGGEIRVYAAYKFFLYTLTGSIFLLLAIIYIYSNFHTMDLQLLTIKMQGLDLSIQKWLWLGFFISFAIKIPMWPFHTWLPYAHVQAPTAGSVILAGILIKIGAYCFLKFSLPLLPEASRYFASFIYYLSLVAIIYTSFVAFVQQDMKKLIAYSSIAHMGYVTIGIFSFNMEGLTGAMVQIISHGLVSSALFLSIGVLYDRAHTKAINDFGGVAAMMPKFATILMIFVMASIGLPGTSGFVGEVMILLGLYQVDKTFAAIASTSVVFSACYMLLLYKKVMLGKVINDVVIKLTDLTKREMVYFIPLVILVIGLGIYPKILTDIFQANIVQIIKAMNLGRSI